MPLFAPAVAPTIESTSHSLVVIWKRDRRKYVEQVKARANALNEDLASHIFTVKGSLDSRLLNLWCKLRWKMEEEDMTDEMLLAQIDRIISTVKNDTLPEVSKLFKNKIHMNLKESDVHERALQYFNGATASLKKMALAGALRARKAPKKSASFCANALSPPNCVKLWKAEYATGDLKLTKMKRLCTVSSLKRLWIRSAHSSSESESQKRKLTVVLVGAEANRNVLQRSSDLISKRTGRIGAPNLVAKAKRTCH